MSDPLEASEEKAKIIRKAIVKILKIAEDSCPYPKDERTKFWMGDVLTNTISAFVLKYVDENAYRKFVLSFAQSLNGMLEINKEHLKKDEK
jgi:hypothetical protein